MTCQKSCFNCEYLNVWNHPGGLEEEPDSGWDCKHPDSEDFLGDDEQGTDQEIAQQRAKNCPGYQFKDWEAQYRLEAEAADYDSIKEPTPEELAQWEQQQQLAHQQRLIELGLMKRLIELGLMNRDGEPTNEYYRLGDQQYDAARERRFR